jgi:plastocyanin
MKRKTILLWALLIAFSCNLRAEIIPVTVANFQFTPSNFIVNVGDVIHFVWMNGSHTTTSTAVPASASAWDNPINSASTFFDYNVLVAGNYAFKCIPHGAGGMTGTFIANAVAPLTLVGFAAKILSNHTIQLNWKTLMEENTDHFLIRRSFDGREFTDIGRLPAAGSSNKEISYSFADTSLSINKRFIYYQLLTIDKDASGRYSEIVLCKQDLIKDIKLISNFYPNPIDRGGHLHLYFNAESKGNLEVSIYANDGKLVRTENMIAVEGVNHSHLPMHGLSPGIYTLAFNMDGKKESYSIVIK